MLRLSKLTDYAVVVLVRLGREQGVQTSPGIAQTTGIPEPTVAKVLKAMTVHGLVTSLRGARGGYRLARDLGRIPISDVIAAIDGPIALTACVDGGGCDTQHVCPMRGRWDPVNAAIMTALAGISLADMQAAALPASLRELGREPASEPGRLPIAVSSGEKPSGNDRKGFQPDAELFALTELCSPPA